MKYKVPEANKYLDAGMISTGRASISLPVPIGIFIKKIFGNSRTHEELFRVITESDLYSLIKHLPKQDTALPESHDLLALLDDILSVNTSELFSYYSLTLSGNDIFALKDIVLDELQPAVDRVAASLIALIMYMEARFKSNEVSAISGQAYTEAVLAISAASLGTFPTEEGEIYDKIRQALSDTVGTKSEKPSVEDIAALYQEVV